MASNIHNPYQSPRTADEQQPCNTKANRTAFIVPVAVIALGTLAQVIASDVIGIGVDQSVVQVLAILTPVMCSVTAGYFHRHTLPSDKVVVSIASVLTWSVCGFTEAQLLIQQLPPVVFIIGVTSGMVLVLLAGTFVSAWVWRRVVT